MAKNIFSLILALSFSLLAIAQVSKGALKAYDRAIDAYIAKDYEQVVVELDLAIKKSPNFSKPYFMKAQIMRDQRRFNFAIDFLKKGLEIDDSEYYRGWFELAELCWGEGMYAEGKSAIETFKNTRAYGRFVRDSTLLSHYIRVKEGLEYSIQHMNDSVKFDAQKLS